MKQTRPAPAAALAAEAAPLTRWTPLTFTLAMAATAAVLALAPLPAWASSDAATDTEATGMQAEPETEESETTEMADADVEAGEKAYQAVCRNCHGPKAQGIASYPKLSDKEVDYITDRLTRYREGEKIGPNSMLMIPHARKLSDEDILNIATYVTTAFD